MRTVLRYEQGRAIWSDNEPSAARMPGHRGSLVTGDPGTVEKGRIHSRSCNRQRKVTVRDPLPPHRPRLSPDITMNGRGRKYATEEDRIAARRKAWRESEQRKRAEQRDWRSRLRAEISALQGELSTLREGTAA